RLPRSRAPLHRADLSRRRRRGLGDRPARTGDRDTRGVGRRHPALGDGAGRRPGDPLRRALRSLVALGRFADDGAMTTPAPAAANPPSVMNCALYGPRGKRDVPLEEVDAALAADPEAFAWIGLFEPE